MGEVLRLTRAGDPRRSSRYRRAMRQKVILDVDTGTDDAVALMTAALSPDLELVGATTVNGNTTIDYTTENTLRVFDFSRRLLSSVTLGSPPTDLIAEKDRLLVLESGILDPNDEAKGSLVQYDIVGHDSLRLAKVIIDSLLRPVFV